MARFTPVPPPPPPDAAVARPAPVLLAPAGNIGAEQLALSAQPLPPVHRANIGTAQAV